MVKLDILAIAAHPDDAELSCSGTIASHVAKGYRVGILDLTQGEMGTRGTPAIRLEESNAAARVLGLSARENLAFEDVFFSEEKKYQVEIAKILRKYRPEIVLANAITDRHPDHGKGGSLATKACFLSGLRRLETEIDGVPQDAWRPKAVYHYIQNNYIEPDLVVDISDYWEVKKNSILAFKSQFFDPESREPESFISRPGFLDFIEARAREMGHKISVTYGEGFTVERVPGIENLFHLI
ncbi:bacillithiol biosynthesis deacetylase BshB1 [Lunatimonas salinarum]|uniref:bacillithiol biosynthesis deacetylase BshB1 n=1 Tax=Lunatimonas salinarum TaxID=1774590 RepID=UPI001ADFF61E|nr:bacillithiol biosynthesis deacetylase BshB1 [Lunatimonas salinarum]